MIEFAPNPTGPAHLGTLRSYAVAWLEAKRTGEPLFVRFDANTVDQRASDNPAWAQQFIEELRALEMSACCWQYLTDRMTTGTLPKWAVARRYGNDGPERAYYPSTPPRMLVPRTGPHHFRAGAPLPMYEELGQDGTRYYFAVRTKDTEPWKYDESLVNLIHMNLRGVTVIVRSHISAFIRPYFEHPAHQWFGLKLPREILTGVVVTDSGALSKSALKPRDPGTVGWAMERLGAQLLRDRVLESAKSDAPIIHVSQICC